MNFYVEDFEVNFIHEVCHLNFGVVNLNFMIGENKADKKKVKNVFKLLKNVPVLNIFYILNLIEEMIQDFVV